MILKCEMCGGRLEPKEGTSNVWVCPYCGTEQLIDMGDFEAEESVPENTKPAVHPKEEPVRPKEKESRQEEEAFVPVLEKEAQNDEEVQDSSFEDSREKKKGKGLIFAGIFLVLLTIFYLWNSILVPSGHYKDGKAFLQAGQNEEAANAFEKAKNYRDAKQLFRKCAYETASRYYENGDFIRAGAYFAKSGDIQEDALLKSRLCFRHYEKKIVAGEDMIAGIMADGTVKVASQYLGKRYKEVSSWSHIVQLTSWGYFRNDLAALKDDGTVVLSECSRLSKLDMPSPETWTDIISLSGNDVCLAGLKADGTVVIAGSGCLEASGWTNIVSISACGNQLAGLKEDGTVVVLKAEAGVLEEVESWTNVEAVYTTEHSVIGFQKDGNVLAAGDKKEVSKVKKYGKDIILTIDCNDAGLKLLTIEGGKLDFETLPICFSGYSDHEMVTLKGDGSLEIKGYRSIMDEVTSWNLFQ